MKTRKSASWITLVAAWAARKNWHVPHKTPNAVGYVYLTQRLASLHFDEGSSIKRTHTKEGGEVEMLHVYRRLISLSQKIRYTLQFTTRAPCGTVFETRSYFFSPRETEVHYRVDTDTYSAAGIGDTDSCVTSAVQPPQDLPHLPIETIDEIIHALETWQMPVNQR